MSGIDRISLNEGVPRRRRTQAERRAETIGKILDASIECLCEFGYAKTSTIQVARRAGVSQGAIFRHYENRVALMDATGVEVARRFLDLLPGAVDAVPEAPDRREVGWKFLRWVCGHPNYLAMHELTDGARSDAELAERLAPTWSTLVSNLLEAAWSLGWPESMTRSDVDAHVFAAFWLWDGWSRIQRISGSFESQFRAVGDQLEEQLIDSLESSIRHFG